MQRCSSLKQNTEIIFSQFTHMQVYIQMILAYVFFKGRMKGAGMYVLCHEVPQLVKKKIRRHSEGKRTHRYTHKLESAWATTPNETDVKIST